MTTKKKRGRPSLNAQPKAGAQTSTDDHQHDPHFHDSENPNTTATRFNRSSSLPRPTASARRNPNLDVPTESGADDYYVGHNDDGSRKRERKKQNEDANLVDLTPSDDQIPKSSDKCSSSSFNALACNCNGGGGADPETFSEKKREFNIDDEEGKHSPKTTDGRNGAELETEPGPASPLPCKKFLRLILDKLQKKDTRGAFAEPVDPEELPDYHEVIEKPMDFSTIRKKLDGGLYFNLEQLEADVYLICSNAMEYNASHTIYFRQARSIQELAKVEFQNLRRSSHNIKEQPIPEQPLKPRRGRPPGSGKKKKTLDSLPTERVSPASPSATVLAPGGDDALRSSHYNLRKGPSLLKFHPTYGFSRASDAGNNVENRNRFADSNVKPSHTRCNRIQLELEDSRRSTYDQPVHFSSSDNLAGFAGIGQERQPLIPVGLLDSHDYARSLVRFAADLGPVAWRIASDKLRSVLPPGVEFGRGWVGATDACSMHHSLPRRPSSSSNLPDNVNLPHSSTSNLSGTSLSHKRFMPNEEDLVVNARGHNPQTEFALSNELDRGLGLQTLQVQQDSTSVRRGVDGSWGGFGLASEEEVRLANSSFNSGFTQASHARQMPNVVPWSIVKPSSSEGNSQSRTGSINVTIREQPLPMDYWGGIELQGRPFRPGVSVQSGIVSSSMPPESNGGFQDSSTQMLEIGPPPDLDLVLQL